MANRLQADAGRKRHTRRYSFEFMPPRTPAALSELRESAAILARLGPDYFSVTYGAGGGTRTLTLETVLDVAGRTGLEGAPHLSCSGSTPEELRQVLKSYQDAGLSHLIALRGDPSSGMSGGGGLRYAEELIELIRHAPGGDFFIEVAAYPEVHPQASSARAGLEHFRRKVAAGADGAITQFFFNPDCYYRFLDSCDRLGLDLPIVPGIMPITNWRQLERFAKRCGAEIPRWLLYRLYDFEGDLESMRDFGADVVTRLCAQLLEQGAPGLHFYTLNRAQAVARIWSALGLRGGDRGKARQGAAETRLNATR